MQHKTRGIVLGFIKYRESSIIASIYTERFGTQKYVVNGVRAKKPRTSMALFQPLTLLNLVVYYNERKELQRISEIKCEIPFETIPFQYKQTAVALFISEVLTKALRQDHENEELFQFLHGSILTLDKMQLEPDNFHLQFLLKFTKFLGFEPTSPQSILEELAHYGKQESFQEADLEIIAGLKSSPYLAPPTVSTNTLRRRILQLVLDFYSIHIDSLKAIKSPTILMEVIR